MPRPGLDGEEIRGAGKSGARFEEPDGTDSSPLLLRQPSLGVSGVGLSGQLGPRWPPPVRRRGTVAAVRGQACGRDTGRAAVRAWRVVTRRFLSQLQATEEETFWLVSRLLWHPH